MGMLLTSFWKEDGERERKKENLGILFLESITF